MLPQMRAVPCRQSLYLVPLPLRRASKDVGLRGHHPSTGTTLVPLCHRMEVVAVTGKGDDVVQEWQVHGAEIGSLCWPVVHLYIDIRVDVAVPEAGIGVVVPDALQVCWHIYQHIVAADHQVASVLEVQLFEEQPVSLCPVVGIGVIVYQCLRCHCAGGIAQLQLHTSHEFRELSHMVMVYFLPSVRTCGVE